jgi:hypothetical protein
VTATLDEDEWSAYCPGSFTPGRYPTNKRLGVPQKQSGFCEGGGGGTPAVQPVARRYSD